MADVDRKTEARTEAYRRLRALPAAYKAQSSEAIARAVLESEAYRQAQSIFIYVSTPPEPDTHAVLTHALADGKAVYVPKCVDKHTMLAVRVFDLHGLKPGAFGIPEPDLPPAYTEPARMDLTVTPCVAAAANGVRLGHGAGYYDRYFAAHETKKMCLCFARLLFDSLPADGHDAPMEWLVTENGAVRIGDGHTDVVL